MVKVHLLTLTLTLDLTVTLDVTATLALDVSVTLRVLGVVARRDGKGGCVGRVCVLRFHMTA